MRACMTPVPHHKSHTPLDRLGPLQTLAWGSKNSLSLSGALVKDIDKGSKIDIDLTLKTGILPIPFKASCPLCGANCTIEIPIIKQKVNFALPACPIKAGSMTPSKCMCRWTCLPPG